MTGAAGGSAGGGPLLGRDAARADVTAALREPGSVVVVAAAGMGATAFLESCAREVDALLVHGRDGVPDAPLVVLTDLIAPYGLDGATALEVLATMPAALLAAGRALVVDDADHLDDASAALIAQSIRIGVPTCLGTRAVADLPGGLRDIGLSLPGVVLGTLAVGATADLAARHAGAELDPPSQAAVWRRSRGRPAVVLDIVERARAVGAIVTTPAGAHLTSLPATTASLAAWQVDIDAIGRHRPLLQRLALAGPLPISGLRHLPELQDHDLASAVAAGLVQEDGEVAEIRTLVLSDLVLDDLSASRRRELAAEVAAMLETHEIHERRDGREDHGGWALRRRILETLAGRRRAEDAAAVVEWLLAQDRRDEALDVVRDASTTADLIARSAVLGDLGLRAEALRDLDRARPEATPTQALMIVDRLTGLLGGRAEDEAEFERRLLEITPLLAAEDRSRVEATAARRRVIRGTPGQVGKDDLAGLLRESLTGSLARARVGSGVEQAESAVLLERGDPAEPADPGDLDHHLRVLIHFLSLVYDGRLVLAREIAEREYATARDAAHPVLGLWAYNRAKIAFHAGQYAASTRIGVEMRQHLAWRDPFGLGPTGEALYAAALARGGHLDEASSVVAALSDEELLVPRARLGWARVQAELSLRSEDPEAAAAVLGEAGHHAVAHDEAHSGLLGLDEAFWVAPNEERARVLAGRADSSGLAEAFSLRARGLLDGDPGLLVRAGEMLEEMVQPGRAAASFRAAAEALVAAGRGDDAAAVRRRATRIELLWEARPWPAPPTAALSTREGEVARRAATRRRSREIAADLGLSVRTVDNHLARAFAKLEVRTRDELAEVLGLAP